MKKRIFGFALALVLIFSAFSMQCYAAESSAVEHRFGKFNIGIDYITSAQISDANVLSVTKLEAVPQDDETNRLHYEVELSGATQNGDIVMVDIGISQQTASGIGSALKKEKVDRVDARNDTDDTHYEIKIEDGKGRMTCYSYYSKTLYTTLVIDFVVGEGGKSYVESEKVTIGDELIRAFHVWDTDIMKSYYKKIDGEHSAVYIWLEEDVPDDAIIGIEPSFSAGNFKSVPEGWNDVGGYIQLENGDAHFSFVAKGTRTPYLGLVRTYDVYIKNHMTYAPKRITEPQVIVSAEVGFPITVKFDQYFTDADGDTLSYEVSVNGAPAEMQTNTRYRVHPKEEGQTVLTVTAWDDLLASESCEIIINATDEHSWSDWTITKPVSCDENGKKMRSCTCCGMTEQEEVETKGHLWSDRIVSKKANCKENGSNVRICTVCGEKDTEIVPLGDHDWEIVSTTVTCGQSGTHQLKCTVCGEKSSKNDEATGLHEWGSWEIQKDATCKALGLQIRKCTVCGGEEQQDIPMKDHEWKDWTITVSPNCGAAGEQRRECKHCDHKETKEMPISGEHSWGMWTVIKEATADAEGLRERSCTICGHREEGSIPFEQYAYVSISSMGSLEVARETVPLEDRNKNGIFDVDDVLIVAHEVYGNPGGYSSSGDYIGTLWGIPTMGIGFLLNDIYVDSVRTAVSHGDDVYAFVYTDYRTYSDKYAKFDRKEVYLNEGDSWELRLSYYAYGTSESTLSGARITIDGKDSVYTTDSSGKVRLTFDAPGTYRVSATSSSVVITPPVCVVYVAAEQIKALEPPTLTDANAMATSLTVIPPEKSTLDPDAVVEYSISEDGEHWGEWQKNNVFEKLKSETTYYVRARYCSSDLMRYENSAASEMIEVTLSGGNRAVYSFGNATAASGETILIPVSLQVDPMQVSRWNMEFQYNKSVFTMNGVIAAEGMEDWVVKANLFTKTAYGTLVQGKSAQMPNGNLLYLSLTVNEGAEAGVYNISLTNTWNVGMKNTFWDENGRYLFVAGSSVAGAITVSGAAADDTTTSSDNADIVYDDVSANAWYAEPVRYMAETELMKGTGEATFAPEMTISRAMLVTLLYRMEGEPETNGKASFEDVENGSYYADAVAWAAENGIVFGVSETMFAPDEDVTREQVAAILYRYQSYLGLDAASVGDLDAFADAAAVSAYAETAMEWAVGEGLIYGIDGKLVPHGNATRAQAATILARYLGE